MIVLKHRLLSKLWHLSIQVHLLRLHSTNKR